ncbi:MAG: tubulin-like doman-containing protein [Actinomycetota bacterium]|nr:tubulin-like doman-containing protein [Actinomycetota bacterium]
MSMRPALVVGLGGTGSFAVTELKARLIADDHWALLGGDLESVGLPEHQGHHFSVQVLALDVDKINRPSVGKVQLDSRTEDLALHAPVGETIMYLRRAPEGGRKAYASIETWLPRAEASKLEVNEATTFMTSGAGQIRQFGRIAFCLDVLNQKHIVGRLGEAVAQLPAASDPRGECGVYVVASVGGGSGAGLLIDTLLYLKEARKRLASQVAMRTFVFVVLPGAFAAVLDHDKLALSEANGYGALRELDRLINAPETVSVVWEPNREVRLDGAVADHVYLLDGSRDLEQGRPLEREKEPQLVFPVAIADAIYAHIFPSSGKVLTSDYPNLSGALVRGPENRYSTLGSYVVQYDWERLVRSLTLRGVGEVLDSQLSEPAANGQDLSEKFLTGQATDTFTNGGEYQALPALFTEVLSSPDAPFGGLDPVSRWLAPATGAAPFPETPTLTDFFPDLRRSLMHWVTEYDNDQVITDTGEHLKGFWGDEHGVWKASAFEPQFHPVANANMRACERDLSRAVHLATAAVANFNKGVGGISAASGFLAAVDERLETYSRYLDKVTLPSLEPYYAAVGRAKEEMHENARRHDGKKQHTYLEAEQALLYEQRRHQCVRQSRGLIGRFRHVTEQIRSEVVGWQATLVELKAESLAERLSIDNERTAGNASPIRRLVPLPSGKVERGFYEDCVGEMDSELRVPRRFFEAMSAREWRVHTSRGGSVKLVSVWTRPINTDHASAPGGEPAPLMLNHLIDQLIKIFLPLRDRHVFEVLEREEVKPADLVDELRFGAARLAAFDQAAQLLHTERNIAVQDWNYVFADWRTDGPGNKLATVTRQLLDGSAPGNTKKPTINMGDLPEPGSMPTTDKILAFSARHLILLDAFRGVQKLIPSYRDRRLDNPSPHVLPEEKGAARLEALSEELAQQGFLNAPVEKIRANTVSLCSDVVFLQRFAMLVANDLVEHDVEDELTEQGRWLLLKEDGELELGTEWELDRVILRVASGQDHRSVLARAGIKRSQLRLVKDTEAIFKLKEYALGPKKPVTSQEEVHRVLRIAAAQLSRQLSSSR